MVVGRKPLKKRILEEYDDVVGIMMMDTPDGASGCVTQFQVAPSPPPSLIVESQSRRNAIESLISLSSSAANPQINQSSVDTVETCRTDEADADQANNKKALAHYQKTISVLQQIQADLENENRAAEAKLETAARRLMGCDKRFQSLISKNSN